MLLKSFMREVRPEHETKNNNIAHEQTIQTAFFEEDRGVFADGSDSAE
ncbi:hypothetical protein [Leptospira ellisii]|nr:hypothetical protein [Leptospira ellisii]